MGFNEFLSSIFGNKATRDMKEIKLPTQRLRNWITTHSAQKRKNSKNISANQQPPNVRKWKN